MAVDASIFPTLSRVRKTSFLERLVSLTEERDLDMLERSMLITICEVLNPQRATLFRKESGHGKPVLTTLYQAEGSAVPTQAEGEPDFATLSADPRTAVFPIPGRKSTLGYVLVQREERLSEDERIMTDGLLRIYHNFLTVLEDSQRDQLTGLYNRRIFEMRFQGLLTQMINDNALTEPGNRHKLQNGDSVWLALIDIDDFKRINDTFGHLYGDEVLILVARFMAGVFREHDLVFRFGGEEFAVMLQAPDRAAAEASFERLRRSLENHMFPQVGRVTVSVGVTGVDGDPVPAMLVGKADTALYHAKHTGKNRVVFHADLSGQDTPNVTPIANDIELF